jgi:hypothetical protein
MTRRRLISGFGLVGWSLAGLGLAWGCSSAPKVRGQLMIAVSADMSIPKNMNEVVVQVLDESGFEQKFTYPIRPEKLGQPMPGTLAIVPPNAGGQHVRVRVIAQRNDGLGGPTPRVVREASVNVPTDRVAMLAMPLRWLCDGKVLKAADGSATSDCGKGKTCAAGTCVSSELDEKTLPAYSPALVFGGGDDKGNGGECMDVQSCFASSVVVTPDGSCTVAIPAGASADSLNVAMVLAPGGDGHCVKNADGSEGRCFLPLDRDPVEGWHEESGRIQLPPVVCAPETVKKIQAVALTTSCKAKDLSVPLCGPWSNIERPASIDGKPPVGSSRDAGLVTRAPDARPPPPASDVDAGSPGSHGDASVTPGAGGATSCAGETLAAVAAPSYLYLVVDQSLDMGGDPAIWQSIAKGLSLVSPGRIPGNQVGLSLFGAQCTGTYSTPTVPFGPAASSGPISTALAAGPQSQASPNITAALAGALTFVMGPATQWGSSTAARSIVLFTAGTAGTCPVVAPDALLAQLQGAKSSGVSTYVLSFPVAGTNQTLLDSIAVAGSSAKAATPVPIDAAKGPQSVGDFITSTLDSTVPCAYSAPAVAGGAGFSVRFTTTSRGTVSLAAVADLARCAGADAFYVAPRGATFTLCPTACTAVRADSAARVETVLGCGSAGAGGASGGGGFVGTGGASGIGGSAGAVGTGGGSSGCTTNAQCGGATPYCFTAGGKCVACLIDAHCPGTTCNRLAGICGALGAGGAAGSGGAFGTGGAGGTGGASGTGGSADAGSAGGKGGAGGSAGSAGAGGGIGTGGAGGSAGSAGAVGTGGAAGASCTDGVKNGAESAIDCGGGTCPRCATGMACKSPPDCVTDSCTAGLCQAASCTDGIKNGTESAIDCGGACAKCAYGSTCTVAADCTTSLCFASVCRWCTPGAKQCTGLTPQTCDASGTWVSGTDCANNCTGGICF